GFGLYSKKVYPDDPALRHDKGPGDAGEDPNKKIRESLDAGRQKAYEQALHGDDDSGLPKTGPSAEAARAKLKPGCYGEASEKFLSNLPAPSGAPHREDDASMSDPG